MTSPAARRLVSEAGEGRRDQHSCIIGAARIAANSLRLLTSGRPLNMKSAGDDSPPGGPYVLGHSDRELDRLLNQARLVDPIPRRFIQAAGVGPGLRVLDVGRRA